MPVVPVRVLVFKRVPHHQNKEPKVDDIEKVVDDHSIDFDVDPLSEVGKEAKENILFFASPVVSPGVSPFVVCFFTHKEDVCVSEEIEENGQHGAEEEKDCLEMNCFGLQSDFQLKMVL